MGAAMKVYLSYATTPTGSFAEEIAEELRESPDHESGLMSYETRPRS